MGTVSVRLMHVYNVSYFLMQIEVLPEVTSICSLMAEIRTEPVILFRCAPGVTESLKLVLANWKREGFAVVDVFSSQIFQNRVKFN